jgi:serine/threonine protein kinase/tetratricopeptide (TPR) repeat protein
LRDRYRLDRELGQGGMATVYLAHDLKHNRDVALKVLRSDIAAELGSERFLREIRLIAQLHHPHILPLYDSGVLVPDEESGTASRPFYIMPYMEGQTLRDRLVQEPQLEIDHALRIARQIAGALDYAHRHHIVHRDIKPENILLEEDHALVADFGIARVIGVGCADNLTATRSIVGTAAYMSPEQVDGCQALDGRSDIFSLGCVLFEMLVGEQPFKGSSLVAIIAKRVADPTPSARALRESVPNSVDAVIRRALRPAPEDRFPTAAAFAEALAPVALTAPEATGVTSPAPSRVEGSNPIAVLPFANLSTDKENDYFSEGMTEELIHALSRIPQLRVASRTSVFNVSRKGLDIRTIGESLGVKTVLEGSVRRAGNRLRISVQLVDTRSGYHLWSEMYDREMQDVFAVQNEISQAITAKLSLSLATEATLVRPPTRSLEAYHSYLRGRHCWNRASEEALLKGIKHFERAIEADPEYAAAHSGLADCYHVLAIFGSIPPKEAYTKVKSAAGRAVALAERSPEGHISLGCAAMCYDWQWDEALTEFERAIELDPSSAHAHYQHAWCLTVVGRRAEALASARRAMELEPLSPHIQAYSAMILVQCGEFEAGLQHALNTLELDPGFSPAFEVMGYACIYLGRHDEALTAWRRIPSSPRVSQALRLAPLHARMGDVDAARRTLEEEEPRFTGGVVPAGNVGFYLAALALALGELDRCFLWLEHLVDERLFIACLLMVDPAWRDIRGHPRFIALLQRLGLEQRGRGNHASNI